MKIVVAMLAMLAVVAVVVVVAVVAVVAAVVVVAVAVAALARRRGVAMSAIHVLLFVGSTVRRTGSRESRWGSDTSGVPLVPKLSQRHHVCVPI